MGLVTQKSIAQRFGVTPQYVNKLVLQGRIKPVGKRVQEHQAVAAMKALGKSERRPAAKKTAKKPVRPVSPRPAKAPVVREPRQSSDTKTQAFWKAQELEFKAKNAQLEYEKNAGLWLARQRVVELEQRKNATIKEKFSQLPRSLAQRLARLTSPAEVESVLRDEVYLVLTLLASDPLGMAEAVPAAAPVEEVEQAPPPAIAAAIEATA